MAYTLIPGIRQDHKGRSYQLARYPNGKCIEIPVEELGYSSRIEAELERIVVESHSSLVPGDPLLNEKMQEKLKSGHLYKQGETYETIRCIHESNI